MFFLDNLKRTQKNVKETAAHVYSVTIFSIQAIRKRNTASETRNPGNWNTLLIAALIFSAGYYSAPIFFLLRRIKKCFALPHFAAFSAFCVKSFWLL